MKISGMAECFVNVTDNSVTKDICLAGAVGHYFSDVYPIHLSILFT
jgi:hypothetical protein